MSKVKTFACPNCGQKMTVTILNEQPIFMCPVCGVRNYANYDSSEISKFLHSNDSIIFTEYPEQSKRNGY